MFEVGKEYDIVALEWGENGLGPTHLFRRVATEIDGSLVKFITRPTKVNIGDNAVNVPGSELIINTASLYFVSATPSDEKK